MTETGNGGNGGKAAQDLPVEELKKAGREFVQALMVRTLEQAGGRIAGLTERLNDAAEGGGAGKKAAAAGVKKLAEGESPVKAGLSAGAAGAKEKVKEAVGGKGGGGKGGGGGKLKVTNIIEQFDVGLPRRVAYDQWTQFADYPSFTKKVESVEQESDEKINWRAQIFLSHRTWESTIMEQVPDERIVWRSKGPKGYVDGSVTFHELAPTMTRILLVAEYHPDGFFEKTANLWRAQGRRLRLDFKHIKRHMMTQTLLKQEEVEGWRGEIRDGEVVKTHEDALKEEEEAKARDEGQEPEEDREPEEGERGQAGEDEEEDKGGEAREDGEDRSAKAEDEEKEKAESAKV
ncbi:SRPBCC family protein [Actinomadura madurae]|uniref:SRPBCC family protein n=2 Tax=Actinomadura madurae TaxID=1993 RepID=UPI002025B9A2|nr:SRPBCC family protein [Actinomadura madurae]MCP9949892.1 SRPBCC family protein [Actinomadura madurae]MCP9966643.1 SRPBCC family protein [Actinomadura madurae]URM95465.1 SRPBCC family protein [Actinomadura madurae]